MNTVERIKMICKERKIPISKLEKECGFGNGYINQLRKGSIPDDRLRVVSDFLKISVDELSTGEKPEIPGFEPEHLELIEMYSKLNKEQKDAVLNLLHAFTL